MRTLLTACILAAALALAATSGAVAQQQANYCLTGGSTDGSMNCSFETLAQCQAAMTGSINERCIRNPQSDSGLPAPSPR